MPEKDTRTAIMDAAQDLIQRMGANAMSYQHISDAVGIRKASIHYHFAAELPPCPQMSCFAVARNGDTIGFPGSHTRGPIRRARWPNHPLAHRHP
jgi:hypothetical protein